MKILQTKRLDHLGMVGAMKELGIIELIDQKMGINNQHKVSTGEAMAAMVMNGLGFVSRPLSLTPQFFETKALDILFSREIESDDLNRHRLRRVLDDVHTYGCELLFSEIASHVCKAMRVDDKFTSIDTTSFSVCGEYNAETDENEINIVQGYSKDRRPDLKQAILELVTSQDGVIPLMMKCFDGNASDSKILKERSKALIRSFKNSETPRYLVGDSKLYQIEASIASLFLIRKKRLIQHSCYVIGTNTLPDELFAGQVIEAYKNQNTSIERGFRFLKDPQFFVSSFFLKKPARIMTLLMIMTLSLLIYSVTQKYLRNELAKKNETLPTKLVNQLKTLQYAVFFKSWKVSM
jgi:transposase